MNNFHTIFKIILAFIIALSYPLISTMSSWSEIAHEPLGEITAVAVTSDGDLWGVG